MRENTSPIIPNRAKCEKEYEEVTLAHEEAKHPPKETAQALKTTCSYESYVVRKTTLPTDGGNIWQPIGYTSLGYNNSSNANKC